uniref:Mutator-like transposase domain-containing protein n=1 Tax=Adineta vaga TaxID=104782 RepID=B3G4Q5_ADIVA|nr:unknown [Adineta vaga]
MIYIPSSDVKHSNIYVYLIFSSYDNLHLFVQQHFDLVARNLRSSHNVKSNSTDELIDLVVSMDGMILVYHLESKSRGFVSKYGIVFVIEMDTGLALDFEVLSVRCERCEKNKREKTAHEFRSWYAKHKSSCEKNWDGTAKAMEVEGAKRLFQRSLIKGFRYKWLICDGDSSAYEAVKNTYVVEEVDDNLPLQEKDQKLHNRDYQTNEITPHDIEQDLVFKEDCINHVQKRVISRLKDLRTKYSRLEFQSTSATNEKSSERSRKHRILMSDGKPYSGSTGRMTKQMEQKFTSLYGNAIRESSNQAIGTYHDAVLLMQTKCRVVFYHYIDQVDKNQQHQFCPKGSSRYTIRIKLSTRKKQYFSFSTINVIF